MKKEIVYQATVNSEGGKIENYVGLTANTFKERFSGHLFNFKHENLKGTPLVHIFGSSKTKIENMKFLGKFYNMQNHSHQKTDNVHFARQRKKL